MNETQLDLPSATLLYHCSISTAVSNRKNMPQSSKIFHPRSTANEPPRKRAKIAHEELEHTALKLRLHSPNPEAYRLIILRERSRPRTRNNAIMAQPELTTNTYIPHTSLDHISLKIKRLQSDLSTAAAGQCWGPGKQNVLDCKHDVDALAVMVKGLDVECIT
jgi:hypothetical protein